MTPTEVGAARLDITPAAPVMLGGFGQRTEPATEVHDPVEAVAVHVTDGSGRVLLVTADLIAVPAPVADAVTAEVGRRTGLTATQVCVAASHTHSGPVPFDPSGSAPGVAAYTERLVAALVDVAMAAVTTTRPAVLRSGVGDAELGFNRWRPDDPDQVDRRVPVLVADDAGTGEPLVVLFGAGCHPTTMGWDNPAVSADYPGVAKRLVADRTGAIAAFVNTTEGDVVPFTSPRRDALDPRGYCGGSWLDALSVGGRLADEVVRVVAAVRATPTEPTPVGAARIDLSLTPNHGGLDDAAAAVRLAESTAVLTEHLGEGFAERVAPGALWAAASRVVVDRDLDEAEMRRLMVACCYWLGLTARLRRRAPAAPVTAPVQVLRLGGLDLLALPGEALVAVGAEWRRRAGHDRAFVVGLANAHLRYLPRAEHFAEPGWDTRYETVTAGLAPDGVERALDAGTELLVALT
ncbi:MAG TPA: hypothetical protein VK866_00270 [Acidimicrobiales bacterium]|nr:hypothetical protein [Acidimicrobiales bacterium]